VSCFHVNMSENAIHFIHLTIHFTLKVLNLLLSYLIDSFQSHIYLYVLLSVEEEEERFPDLL